MGDARDRLPTLYERVNAALLGTTPEPADPYARPLTIDRLTQDEELVLLGIRIRSDMSLCGSTATAWWGGDDL